MIPYSVQRSPHAPAIQAIQDAALAAVEPGAAVQRRVRREGNRLIVDGRAYDLDAYEHLWVIGGGKAAAAMAAALHALAGDRVGGGLVVTKHGHGGSRSLGGVDVVEAGHPLPDEAGVAAAERVEDVARQAGSTGRDLVLTVLSGGCSALWTLPAHGLSLADLQATTELLLRAGATIGELNAVRKHVSRLKGGDLARLAAPSPVITLVLSDVVGDPPDTIASGPAAPDPSTFEDAWAVLERYELAGRVPATVVAHLRAGLRGERPETLKEGDPRLAHVQTVIVGSNRLAAEAAAQEARRQGFNPLILSTFVEGEARQVARVAAALAREVATYDRPVPRPACLVWGGETTVTVRGTGRGGRNQELALAAAIALDGVPGVLLMALGTDGTDGPTDAAGAVSTGETMARARAAGLDAGSYLANNDAYPFFEALNDLIRTGPTGTNVNDLLFMFAF
jgi:hydroxypyruvate reductase